MTPPVQEPQRSKPKRTSGIVVPHAAKWHQRLAGHILYAALRALNFTLRYRLEDTSGLFLDGQNPGPAGYCIWHNRLALSLFIHEKYIRRNSRTEGLAAMVSASKDGGFLSVILECFKVKPVRGSSSRRGPQALRELTTWLRRGYDLALTPDGPRGPRYVVQEGVVALGQITGRPIIPVGYDLQWKIRVKSWDQFQIPLPFSRVVVRIGQAIQIPREATEEQRESYRLELERQLKELSRE